MTCPRQQEGAHAGAGVTCEDGQGWGVTANGWKWHTIDGGVCVNRKICIWSLSNSTSPNLISCFLKGPLLSWQFFEYTSTVKPPGNGISLLNFNWSFPRHSGGVPINILVKYTLGKLSPGDSIRGLSGKFPATWCEKQRHLWLGCFWTALVLHRRAHGGQPPGRGRRGFYVWQIKSYNSDIYILLNRRIIVKNSKIIKVMSRICSWNSRSKKKPQNQGSTLQRG